MTCAAASIVPDFEVLKCFVSTGDPQLLVNKMIHRSEKLADASFQLVSDRFESIYAT